MPPTRAFAILLASAALLAGCGAEGDTDSPREVVGRFARAVRDRDAGLICSRYLSQELRDQLTRLGRCEDVALTVAGHAPLEVRSVRIQGDEATVRVRRSGKAAAIRLVRQDDAWRIASLG